MPAQTTQKKLITKAEAARRLGICRNTLYQMIKDNRLQLVRIAASKSRIKADEVNKILGVDISITKGVAM